MPQLFIKGSWALPYTFERIDQALHRGDDDPLPVVPSLEICGIGKATNTVAIVYNLIRDKKEQDWADYTPKHLDTATISQSEKPRTQLSFTLTHNE